MADYQNGMKCVEECQVFQGTIVHDTRFGLCNFASSKSKFETLIRNAFESIRKSYRFDWSKEGYSRTGTRTTPLPRTTFHA